MSSLTYRGRVELMYAVYAPERLDKVPDIMLKYAGHEEALLNALVQKYGPEPAAPTPETSTAAEMDEVPEVVEAYPIPVVSCDVDQTERPWRGFF
mmetsp:Transcript_54879/g.169163  ORF Transcript_54879/g.169163 Transcript_54879/m.169163 type:complete len:95 (+) Transcript_54879:53-337(+)